MNEIEGTIWKFLIAVLGAGVFPTIWLAMLFGGGSDEVSAAPARPTYQHEAASAASRQVNDTPSVAPRTIPNQVDLEREVARQEMPPPVVEPEEDEPGWDCARQGNKVCGTDTGKSTKSSGQEPEVEPGNDTCVTTDGRVVKDTSPNCAHYYYTEDTLPCGPGAGCVNDVTGRPWVCELLEPGPTERFRCG